MIKLLGYVIAVVVVLALILCVPFLTIWMINVFGEVLWPGRQLPYTLETWAAACLLSAVFTPSIRSKRD
jgi:hypothetical protein